MSKKYISIAIMLAGVATVTGCVSITLAQDSGTMMPPPPSGTMQYPTGGTPPPPPSGGTEGMQYPSYGGTMPPPPDGGTYQSNSYPPPNGAMQPPSGGTMPPPPRDGSMMPPPPGGTGSYSGGSGQYPSPEEMKGIYEQKYQEEYQKQYNQEFQRQSGGQYPQPRPPEGEMRPQGQPSGDGRMMPPQGNFGQSWGGDGGEFGGPDDEEREKMMEEQEKRMKADQLRQMKRGFGGMESGIKQTKKIIDRLQKKNVAVPEEYLTLINELTQALNTVKNATEFDESVESAMELIQEKGHDLGEIGPKLGMLEQWPKTISQAEKEVKKVNNFFAKAKKKKGASEYASLIAKVEAKVNDMNARFASIKSAGAAGDFEEAMENMQEFFESIGDMHREIGILDQISNISKMIRQGEKEISQFEKQVKKLEKKGVNVSAVTAFIAQGRAKMAELKELARDTGAEPEDFFEIVEELDAIREQAMNEFNELSGKSNSLEGAVIRALFPFWERR